MDCMHTCKKHGYTRHRAYIQKKNGKYKYDCVKCISESVKRRRHKIKKYAVDLLGGKCSLCGYSKCIHALELHHLDPNEKDFSLADKGINFSLKRVETEVKKCVLLCANCHREVHNGITKI